MRLNNIVDGIRAALYVRAARQDAFEGQSDRLLSEMPDVLQEYSKASDPHVVINWIQDIMGPDWEPSEEWQETIHPVD